eukprot:764363-Hanusia_phi.AAC.7
MADSQAQPAAAGTERKPWLFSEHELENTPSRQDKMTRELERAKRKSVCKLIAELGQLIKPPASLCAINSGKVFFHRVFMVQSMAEGRQNPKIVGVTCLFLACKSEECLRSLKQFIWALNKLDYDSSGKLPFGDFHDVELALAHCRIFTGEVPEKRNAQGQVVRRKWEIEEDSQGFQEVRANIIQLDHPVAYMRSFIHFIDKKRKPEENRSLTTNDGDDFRLTDLGEDILCRANAMANDSTTITLPLQYEGSVIAIGCVALALKINKFQIEKMKKWVKDLGKYRRTEREQCMFDSSQLTRESIEGNDHAGYFSCQADTTPDVQNKLLDLYDEAHAAPSQGQANSSGSNGGGAKSASESKPPTPQDSAKRPNGHHSADTSLQDKCARLERGETVLHKGSKEYEITKAGNVYKCTCVIWRSITEVEERRTCKHLIAIRGEKEEMGRVGEEYFKKSDQVFHKILQEERRNHHHGAHADHKRKSEHPDGFDPSKRPNHGH